MLFKALIVSSATLYSTAAVVAHDKSHERYEHMMKYIGENDIMPVSANSSRAVGIESGSFVTTIYTTLNCAKDTEFTASGYTLGSCISAGENSSFRYTSCSMTSTKTVVGMDSCTSNDCTDCTSFDVPFDTGCQTMSLMTCSSEDKPWEKFDFDYHALMYWGEDDCGGNYDQWTAVDSETDDCDDLSCHTYDNNGSKYSIEGFCD